MPPEITIVEVQVEAAPTIAEVLVPGAQGPQGEQGPTGATGATGPQGPAGSQYGNVDGGAASAVFLEIQNLDGEGA